MCVGRNFVNCDSEWSKLKVTQENVYLSEVNILVIMCTSMRQRFRNIMKDCYEKKQEKSKTELNRMNNNDNDNNSNNNNDNNNNNNGNNNNNKKKNPEKNQTIIRGKSEVNVH